MPFLQALVMQWHRHKRPFFNECLGESWVVNRLRGKPSQIFRKVQLTAILEAMDHFQRAFIPHHRRTCKFKGKLELCTVGAGEILLDQSREALAAELTKWGPQAWQCIVAGVAESLTICQFHLAEHTARWIQKIQDPLPNMQLRMHFP